MLSAYVERMSSLWVQASPLIPRYAVIRCFVNTSVDVREEDEMSVALQLDKSMISALIEPITIGFMRNINLMITFSTLGLHCVAINSWSLRVLAKYDRHERHESN